MPPIPPFPADLPVIRRCVAEYCKRVLRGTPEAHARETAYSVFWSFRPRAATDEVKAKVDNAIDWAIQEFPEWMGGGRN